MPRELARIWNGGRLSNVLRVFHRDVPVGVDKTIPTLYISYDGTGVPIIASELEGRKGNQPDGSAKTREMKLGCVFTQTTTDAEGFPIRDPESTTFVRAIETAEQFGKRLYAEAVRRGLWQAKRVVVVADAAEWVKNLANLHFPQAIQIVDLYHARQHVSDLCKLLFLPDEKQVVRYRIRWWTALDRGKIERICDEARQAMPHDPDREEQE